MVIESPSTVRHFHGVSALLRMGGGTCLFGAVSVAQRRTPRQHARRIGDFRISGAFNYGMSVARRIRRDIPLPELV